MTVIEFFDKTSVENVLGALLCRPERVIYLGSSTKQMKRQVAAYEEILRERGFSGELIYKSVNRNSLQSILDVLEDLVHTYPDCTLNLDGGAELYLVAAGMIAQRCSGKVKLHRFNVRNNTIIDCDTESNDQRQSPIGLRVDENVRLYGGKVLYDTEKSGTTHRWDFSPDFCRDIRAMWDICRENPSQWNYRMGILDRMQSLSDAKESGVLRVSVAKVESALGRKKSALDRIPELLNRFAGEGLIRELEIREDVIAFRYKNDQVFRCLTKAGQILELLIAALAAGLKDEGGEPLYYDVQTGVCLDWDGKTASGKTAEVTNEVDVLLMKGVVPVFVSCKNGQVETEELYKLSTVAEQFGARYAKKVLVASELEKMGTKAEYLRARAADMDIRILENVDGMDFAQLEDAVASFWCN